MSSSSEFKMLKDDPPKISPTSNLLLKTIIDVKDPIIFSTLNRVHRYKKKTVVHTVLFNIILYLNLCVFYYNFVYVQKCNTIYICGIQF